MKKSVKKNVKAKKLFHEKVTKCRLCGSTDLIPCLDIGDQYLSSVFPENLNYRKTTYRYPLQMVICNKKGDTTCGLLQLGHRFDLTPMYKAYPYTSSSNSAMPKILLAVAESGRKFDNLEKGDTILDIGGNDGTLLSFFKNEPVKLINIDAAKNVKSLLSGKNYTHVRDYFTKKSYDSVTKSKAKLIFSIAMFYHLDDPQKLSRDVAACLDDDGVWIIQMAYLPAMVRTNMYNNIVHEHAGYYGVAHMKWLMERVGLEVFDAEENDVYGGSIRVFVKKAGNKLYKPTARYNALLKKEMKDKMLEAKTHIKFMKRVEKTKNDLIKLCRKLKAQGKSIWIYGASTKGNTIMQYCGLGRAEIDAAADSNPFKIGKYVIGSDVIIKSEEEMRAARPDYLLALPYSFVDAFMKREAGLVAQGTKFIIPLPEVKIVGKKK